MGDKNEFRERLVSFLGREPTEMELLLGALDSLNVAQTKEGGAFNFLVEYARNLLMCLESQQMDIVEMLTPEITEEDLIGVMGWVERRVDREYK